jgi:hypothetical protein
MLRGLRSQWLWYADVEIVSSATSSAAFSRSRKVFSIIFRDECYLIFHAVAIVLGFMLLW